MTIRDRGFRDDINGLRAWAVVVVILYHFGITGFSGGFIGVDVFFVISGFLMTGIIVGALEKTSINKEDKFSLMNFYLSRARRIIPALLLLCVSLLLVGWLVLPALEYKALSVHVVSALSFLSNIKFWNEAGYFDAASHEKLLLHTWSLSVEWQFYLILPLMLLAVWKIRPGRNSLVVTIVLCFFLSLALCLIVTPIAPSAAFYLLPTRAWEMLAGSLVCLLVSNFNISERRKVGFELFGFSLIISSVFLFDTSSIWPGWRALIPVLGTTLVLISARSGSLFTSNVVAQRLGGWSYSLYLWHWPFVVGLVYIRQENNSFLIVIGLILTLVMGWISYRLVESAARSSLARMPSWASASALLSCTLVVVLLSFQIRLEHGVSGRLPTQVEAIFDEAENINPRRGECQVSGNIPVPECTYGGDQLGVIVIGDSHAASVIRSVERSLPSQNLHVLDWTLSGCPTISGIKKLNEPSFLCGDFVLQAIKKQKNLPPSVPIVIVNRIDVYLMGPNELNRTDELRTPSFYLSSPFESRSSEYLQEMRRGVIETACEFAKTRTVYMVRPIPELKVDVPKSMGRALMLGRPTEVFISMEEYQERHAFSWETQDMAAERCGIKILDPLPSLCSEGRCRGTGPGSLPIYSDSNHLSERGGALLIPMFRQIFETPIVQR